MPSSDVLLDLTPLTTLVNPFHGAADLMAPEASKFGEQGAEVITFLRALGDATTDILTADKVLILTAGRIALSAEQRGTLRHLCDRIDDFIGQNS